MASLPDDHSPFCKVEYFNSPELCDTILQAINCITKSKALAGRASFYDGLAKALSFTLCYNSETSGKTFLSVNDVCSHVFTSTSFHFDCSPSLSSYEVKKVFMEVRCWVCRPVPVNPALKRLGQEVPECEASLTV